MQGYNSSDYERLVIWNKLPINFQLIFFNWSVSAADSFHRLCPPDRYLLINPIFLFSRSKRISYEIRLQKNGKILLQNPWRGIKIELDRNFCSILTEGRKTKSIFYFSQFYCYRFPHFFLHLFYFNFRQKISCQWFIFKKKSLILVEGFLDFFSYSYRRVYFFAFISLFFRAVFYLYFIWYWMEIPFYLTLRRYICEWKRSKLQQKKKVGKRKLFFGRDFVEYSMTSSSWREFFFGRKTFIRVILGICTNKSLKNKTVRGIWQAIRYWKVIFEWKFKMWKNSWS